MKTSTLQFRISDTSFSQIPPPFHFWQKSEGLIIPGSMEIRDL